MISVRANDYSHVTELGPTPLIRVSSEAAVMAVRSALQAQLRTGGPNGELRRAIRHMCDEARRNDLRAEQLLVVFKRAWESLPELGELPAGPDRSEFLSRVVSMCIEEFYDGQDPQ
jgi:hypothetical protein